MLIDQLKQRLRAAMKAQSRIEKEILKVALGEIQTDEARGVEATDVAVSKVLKKLVKSNRETLDAAQDPEQKRTLEQEIEVIESLLPRCLSAAEIESALAPVLDALKNAPSDGPAVGIAMKHLKSSGAEVEGKDVSAVVRKLRA